MPARKASVFPARPTLKRMMRKRSAIGAGVGVLPAPSRHQEPVIRCLITPNPETMKQRRRTRRRPLAWHTVSGGVEHFRDAHRKAVQTDREDDRYAAADASNGRARTARPRHGIFAPNSEFRTSSIAAQSFPPRLTRPQGTPARRHSTEPPRASRRLHSSSLREDRADEFTDKTLRGSPGSGRAPGVGTSGGP